MESRISPKYSYDKLENPSEEDLIDVFEDRWQSFVFAPVKALINDIDHGDMAAMTILSSYYEAIESLYSGISSKNNSKQFFVKGFLKVFIIRDVKHQAEAEKAATEIYSHIRCGLAHQGMLHHKVLYSRSGKKPFYLTYPTKKDGTPDTSKDLQSIVVNPEIMYLGTQLHFDQYIKQLRSGKDKDQLNMFTDYIRKQFDIGGSTTCHIGLTEEEFTGKKVIEP